jgi:hypothetical protein
MVALDFAVPNFAAPNFVPPNFAGANLLGGGSELTKNWRPLLSSITLAI